MENEDYPREVTEETGADIHPLFVTPGKFQPANKTTRRKTPKRKFTEDAADEQQGHNLRPRTPSGQVLTSSVEHIKRMLTEKSTLNQKALSDEERKHGVIIQPNRVHGHQATDQHDYASPIVGDQTNGKTNCEVQPNPFPLMPQMLPMAEETKLKERIVTSGDEYMKVLSERNMTTIKELEENISKEAASTGDKARMGVRTVIKMFDDLKINIKQQLEELVSDGRIDLHTNDDRVKSLELQCLQLKNQVGICESKERIMINTMAGMSNRIKEIENKLENIEMDKGKKMLVIANLEVSEKRKVCRSQLYSFFTDQMGVEVRIEDFYFIGQNQPRDVVVCFQSSEDKHAVLQNVTKVKDHVNSQGKKFFFRDYKTSKQNEFYKKCQAAANLMANEDEVDKKEISVQANQLYVGDQPYEQKIVPPDATDVLRYSIEDLNRIMSTPVGCQAVEEYKGNKFTAYCVPVKSFQMIRDVYMKLRLNHAAARHIVCAYRVPGLKLVECNDCCDDEEYGVAGRLLEILCDNNITHTALYVVRNCGQKLKEEKAMMYVKVAVASIKKSPVNLMTNKQQNVSELRVSNTSPNSYAAAVMSRNNPNRKEKRGYVKRGGKTNRGGRGRGCGDSIRGRGGWQGHREEGRVPKAPVVYIPKEEEDGMGSQNHFRFATPWEENRAQMNNDDQMNVVD